MATRYIKIGSYDTAAQGWTLSALKITKGAQVQSFVPVPGRSAPLDLSTALTDGVPTYGNATLEATLERSDGTRSTRETKINDLVAAVDGLSLHIEHPDQPGLYLIGRVQITRNYSDLAHCSVNVSAVCDPWFYYDRTTAKTINGTGSIVFNMTGRKPFTPTLKLSGAATLSANGTEQALSAGTYTLPWLTVTSGTLTVNVATTAAVTITATYREGSVAQ